MKKLLTALSLIFILTSCSVNRPVKLQRSCYRENCFTIDTITVYDSTGKFVKNSYIPHKVKHASMAGTYASGMLSGIVIFSIILMALK